MNGLSTARKFETVQPANKYKCKNGPPSEKRKYKPPSRKGQTSKSVRTIHGRQKTASHKFLTTFLFPAAFTSVAWSAISTSFDVSNRRCISGSMGPTVSCLWCSHPPIAGERRRTSQAEGLPAQAPFQGYRKSPDIGKALASGANNIPLSSSQLCP